MADGGGQLAFDFPDEPTIQARFEEFHAANPAIYALFLRFARELKAAGCRRSSADLIAQRIRWEVAVTTRSHDGWKLNNNFVSRYARLILADHPDEFRGFFEFRRIRTP